MGRGAPAQRDSEASPDAFGLSGAAPELGASPSPQLTTRIPGRQTPSVGASPEVSGLARKSVSQSSEPTDCVSQGHEHSLPRGHDGPSPEPATFLSLWHISHLDSQAWPAGGAAEPPTGHDYFPMFIETYLILLETALDFTDQFCGQWGRVHLPMIP